MRYPYQLAVQWDSSAFVVDDVDLLIVDNRSTGCSGIPLFGTGLTVAKEFIFGGTYCFDAADFVGGTDIGTGTETPWPKHEPEKYSCFVICLSSSTSLPAIWKFFSAYKGKSAFPMHSLSKHTSSKRLEKHNIRRTSFRRSGRTLWLYDDSPRVRRLHPMSYAFSVVGFAFPIV